MRRYSQKTTQKYLNFLHSLKEKLNNENHSNLKLISFEYNVSTAWVSFLLSNNIVYKETHFYCWNEKIPVSGKLIQKYREYKYKDYKECKNLKLNNQTAIVFDKKEIKKSVDKFKPVKFTHVKTEQKIGVIRKFLRWLW